LPGALQQFHEDLPDIRRDVPIYLLTPESDALARFDADGDENAHRAEVLA
jgi:hypothetical protein